MKERPILFSSEMVKAILEGRKTKTRRLVRIQPPNGYIPQIIPLLRSNDKKIFYWDNGDSFSPPFACPYGTVGNRLWVRETWYYEEHMHDSTEGMPDLPCGLYSHRLVYKADCTDYPVNVGVGRQGWRPSIFMPRWASRITLEITGISVEQLQDISAVDAISEGINVPPPLGVNMPPSPEGFEKWSKANQDKWINGQARDCYIARCADVENQIKAFRTLWNSINGRKSDKTWKDNPWVWVIEFKRINND